MKKSIQKYHYCHPFLLNHLSFKPAKTIGKKYFQDASFRPTTPDIIKNTLNILNILAESSKK